jgi:hypothetical protein
MQIIEQFKFSKDVTFELMVPPFEEKDNYFYEPTEALHKFDVGTVMLNINTASTMIIVEAMQDIVCSLSDHLKKTLQNERPLPLQVPLGSLMTFYNHDHYRNYWRDEKLSYIETSEYHPFWLWSTPDDMQSWIYNRDGKIYLEIGKVYIVSEPQNDQAFEEFMSEYKPLFFEEIPHAIAQDWLEKSEKIVHAIGSDYKD